MPQRRAWLFSVSPSHPVDASSISMMPHHTEACLSKVHGSENPFFQPLAISRPSQGDTSSYPTTQESMDSFLLFENILSKHQGVIKHVCLSVVGCWVALLRFGVDAGVICFRSLVVSAFFPGSQAFESQSSFPIGPLLSPLFASSSCVPTVPKQELSGVLNAIKMWCGMTCPLACGRV